MEHSSLLSTCSCCISIIAVKYPNKGNGGQRGFIGLIFLKVIGHNLEEVNIGIQCIMSTIKKGKKKTKP